MTPHPLGGGSDSSVNDMVNPGGAGGNLCTMANSLELPVPSGSEVLGLSGVCMTVDSSSWGSGSSGSPVSSAVLEKSQASPQPHPTWGYSADHPSWWGMLDTYESLRQLHKVSQEMPWFHSATILSCLTTPDVLGALQWWREEFSSFQPSQAGWGIPPVAFFVGPWIARRPQLVFLLGPAPPVHWGSWNHVAKEQEFLPPTQYLPILLDVYPDPCAVVTWVRSW